MNGHDAAGVRGGRPALPCPVFIQGQDAVVPRDVSAEPDPLFKDEKTSPCAHVPQLVPYSGYLGMCAEIVDIGFFPESPCILRPATYNARLCQRARSSVG